MTTSEMPGQTLGRQGVMPPGPTPMVVVFQHDEFALTINYVFVYLFIHVFVVYPWHFT